MALIKTIQEAKEVLPKLLSSLDSDDFLPNCDTAEEKYIVPIIGEDLYADLSAKYDANSFSADEVLLVKHINLVTLAYGFLDDLISLHVLLTENGVRTMDTGNMPKAVGWEYKELKAFLRDRALDGTEVLLKYLWKQKDSLTLWTDSEAYQQFQSLLIRTGTDFNEQYQLFHPMRTFYALKSILSDVQDDYIMEPLGKELFKYLLETSLSSEEKVIEKYLKKSLAFYTIKRAGDHYNVRFSESGFTVINEIMGGDRETEDSGRSSASLVALQAKLKACHRDGLNYWVKAKSALKHWRASGNSSPAFNTAYDAGPLGNISDYKTLGNERRKSFRFN